MADRNGRGGGRGYRDRGDHQRPHHGRGGRGNYQPRHFQGQGGGGGGGGGGRGGGGRFGGGGRQHAGHKRGRDDQPVEDPYKQLVARLMAIGSLKAQREPEVDMEEVARMLRREVSREERTADTISLLLLCATQLTTKTPHFAALVGLLEKEQPEFVAQLLAKGREELDEALATGQRTRSRLLLRFFAALAAAGVVEGQSLVASLQVLVDRALQLADAGSDPSGHTWQPYADHLVYLALMSLPWCAERLAAGPAGAALQGLMDAVEQYMGRRPLAQNVELQPFYAAKSADDTAALSDSGAASFLAQLYVAAKECQVAAHWEVRAVPHLNMGPGHQQQQEDEEDEQQEQQQQRYQLALAQPPLQPPGVEAGLAHSVAATAVLKAYPPRGGIRLLPVADLSAEPPAIDRIVAEEYMLDTLELEEGDRINCARILSSAMPLAFSYDSLLAETLFSQMLRLPQPALQPAAYGTIMVELCRMMPQGFPRAMSACVRENFNRMAYMDPELRARLAEWLPYHLSNFHFGWPWDRWAKVTKAPEYDAQRHFCGHVISRLVRLAFYHRIKETLPEPFWGLLGPEPMVDDMPAAVRDAMFPAPPQRHMRQQQQQQQRQQQQAMKALPAPPPPKASGDQEMAAAQQQEEGDGKQQEEGAAEGQQAGAEGAAQGADVEMAEQQEAAAAAAEAGGGAAESEQEAAAEVAAAEAPAEPEPPSREDVLVAELVARIRSKQTPPELESWLQQECGPGADMDEGGGGEEALQVAAVRVVARGVLLAGCKSWEHTSRIMERYAEIIRDTCAAAGPAGAAALLDCAAAVWQNRPQRLVMVVGRVIALQLLPGPDVVEWLFTWSGWSSLADPRQTALALELLFDVVAQTQALVQEAAAAGGVLAREIEQCQREIDNLVAHQQEKAQAGKQDALPLYLDKMRENEAAARQRLAKLSERQAQQPQQVEAAHARLDQLLLAIYRCFASWLKELPAPPAAAAPEPAEGEGQEAQQMDTDGAEAAYLAGLRLGTFRAFSRHFFAESARVAAQVEQLFSSEEVPAAAREVVATTLRLQIALQ